MQPLTNDFTTAFGLSHRLGTKECHHASRAIPIPIRRTHFQRTGAWRSLCSSHTNPIGANGIHMHVLKRHGDIRADIAGWISDLVNQLFFHSLLSDHAPCVIGFGDHALPCPADLRDRKPQMRRIRNVEPIGSDSSGDVGAAFQEMPRDSRASQCIPCILFPTKRMDTRRHDHRWVRHATGNDQIGSGIQGSRDPLAPHVGVCCHQSIPHSRDRCVRIKVRKAGLRSSGGTTGCLQYCQAIVSKDDSDLQRSASLVV